MPQFFTTILLLISAILAFEVLAISGKSFYENGNEIPAIPIVNRKVHLRNPADKRPSSVYIHRLSCIRRGGACDHRPDDCCFSSSCRCNLWGSNCRCQRVGLFQKWG